MTMQTFPKSAGVGFIAGTVALVIAAPLMLFGSKLWPGLNFIGFVFFWVCCIVGLVAFGFYNINLLRGKYVSLKDKPWRQQIW